MTLNHNHYRGEKTLFDSALSKSLLVDQIFDSWCGSHVLYVWLNVDYRLSSESLIKASWFAFFGVHPADMSVHHSQLTTVNVPVSLFIMLAALNVTISTYNCSLFALINRR